MKQSTSHRRNGIDRCAFINDCLHGCCSLCLRFYVCNRPLHLLSTHADRLGVDILVTVFCCFFVTDFFADVKASGVKFFTVVRRRPGRGISHFTEHCSTEAPPEVQNQTNRLRRPRWGAMARATHGPHVGSACVDIRPSPKTDVLAFIGCLLSDPILLPKRRIICRPIFEQTYYTVEYFTECILLEIQKEDKYVRLRGRPYIHTCRSYVHTPRDFTSGASLARRVVRALSEL